MAMTPAEAEMTPEQARKLVEEAAKAGERAAGTDTADDGIDIVFHLLEDFRAGGRLMRQRVGGIGELVDEEALHLRRDAFGHVLIIVGMPFADI